MIESNFDSGKGWREEGKGWGTRVSSSGREFKRNKALFVGPVVNELPVTIEESCDCEVGQEMSKLKDILQMQIADEREETVGRVVITTQHFCPMYMLRWRAKNQLSD